jgi:NAD-dependent dihydropyrimidine dehydrogenase PreA subunit
MTYVINDACIGVQEKECVEVCPVDCIYDVGEMLLIHPEECIDCGACETACPVQAITHERDVYPEGAPFIAINAAIAESPEKARAALGEWRTAAAS